MKRRYVKHTPHQHTTLPSARASVRRRLRQVAYTGLRLPPLGRAKTCNSKWSGRQRETSCFCSQWLPQPWLQGPFAHRTLFTPPHLHASWFAMVVLYSPRLCCLAGSSSTPAILPRPERHTLLQAEVRTNDECAGDAHHCQHTSSTTHTATAQGRLLTLACGFHRLAELRSATVSGVVVNGRHPVSVANGCHNPGRKDPSHTARCLHHSIHRML